LLKWKKAEQGFLGALGSFFFLFLAGLSSSSLLSGWSSLY
jgi:hypothetical protein